MKTLTVTRSADKDNMWVFHDIRQFSSLAHLKNETWYHYQTLRQMRAVVTVWQVVNPTGQVNVQHDNTTLPLMTDGDWAIALLRFGP